MNKYAFDEADMLDMDEFEEIVDELDNYRIEFFNASEVFDLVLRSVESMKEDYEGMLDEMEEELKELRGVSKKGDADQIVENLEFLRDTVRDYMDGIKGKSDDIVERLGRFFGEEMEELVYGFGDVADRVKYM